MAQRLADERRVTFRSVAQRWIEEPLFYRSAGYVAQIVRWLDAYVNPAIGDMRLADVQPGDVLAIIKGRAHTAVTRGPAPMHLRLLARSPLELAAVLADGRPKALQFRMRERSH